MGIGSKIKEYRTKAGLTQKDLADELHVTYQAVSRWENDDAEPSFDMLRDMCRILNCTTNDLFEIDKEEVEEKKESQPQIIEKVIIKEVGAKPVLAVCEQCNKPIYESDDLIRLNEYYSVMTGKITRLENGQRILCSECNAIRLQQEKEIKERKKAEELSICEKRRKHSFIWSSILAIIFVSIAIALFINGYNTGGVWFLILAVSGYTFLGTMILNNTFIPKMWLEITSWGFVKMPGVIFSFSWDGLKFLIAMKIILFTLSIAIALFFASLATVVALVLCLFVYPHALNKNLKGNE